jgi:hypothetical protein
MLQLCFLLQDAFGGQPVQELLAQQGLDKQLQLSVLHGVLMADCVPGQAPGTAASQQQQPDNLLPFQTQLTAEQALQRLRVYLQSSGRYGADTGTLQAASLWWWWWWVVVLLLLCKLVLLLLHLFARPEPSLPLPYQPSEIFMPAT